MPDTLIVCSMRLLSSTPKWENRSPIWRYAVIYGLNDRELQYIQPMFGKSKKGQPVNVQFGIRMTAVTGMGTNELTIGIYKNYRKVGIGFPVNLCYNIVI